MAPRASARNGAQRKQLAGFGCAESVPVAAARRSTYGRAGGRTERSRPACRAAARLSSRRGPADDERVKNESRPAEGSLNRNVLLPPGAFLMRGWLIAFALLISGMMASLFAANILHERSVAVSVARRGVENLAESLALQAGDTFEAVDGALLSIAQRVENDGMGQAQRDGLRESMAGLVTTMPRLHGLIVIDAYGRFVVSNSSAAPRPDLRFDDSTYFLYHRNHSGPSTYISGPLRSNTENRWVITLSRRLDRPDGSFAGIAVAQIALDYFKETYAGVDVGQSGAISLFADDGSLVFRRPEAYLGRRLPLPRAFADPYSYQTTGYYIGASTVDNVHRLFAFRRLERFPFVVIVAVADNEYLAEWQAAFRAHVAVLLFVTLLIGGLAFGLGAQIDRRRNAEHNLALVDALTGLANRRQFDTVLEREWRRAVREQTGLALLMVDVDNFKAFNDRYGHRHGDVVLTTIAQAIETQVVRPGDVAARYGGEEFAVILPATDTSSALVVAERIRRAIVSLDVPHADAAELVASVSVGVASLVPLRTDECAMLIDAADAALYEAKRAGRNRSATAPDAAATRSGTDSELGRRRS
jgi:diguanylate cyclase (GGDEF)-like protein